MVSTPLCWNAAPEPGREAMDLDFASPIASLTTTLRQPELLWQLAALAVCLALAWTVQRHTAANQLQEGDRWAFGRRGLKRTVFPLTALVLVFVARTALKHWYPVYLLDVASSLLLSLAVIRAAAYVLRYAFAPSGWVASFERVLAGTVWAVVALHILGLLPEVIEALQQVSFSVGNEKLTLWLVLQGLAIVLVTILLALWLGGLIEARLVAATNLYSNLRIVFARLAKALLVLLAILIGLPLVGIDITTLSVFGGALGVGLGFGLQKVAANYVSGFIILLDRSIRLGNMIEVDRYSGEVTQITTRYTVLRSLGGVEAIVPNEVMMSSVVMNQTYTNTRVRLSIKVQVAYRSDVERAMRLLVDVAQAHSRVLKDPAPKAFLAAFGESGIDLELGFWIADPQEGTLGVRSDLNLEILRGFRREAIEIPFPQRELRMLASAEPPAP